MNNLESLAQKENNEEVFQYGMSFLHAWIRSMECLLHIAYRLDFKKWSCRGDDKEKISLRKSAIQQAFKKECGLLINVVKQGVGTTNDGNTARRFFRDAETTARITGIDKDLIESIHKLLVHGSDIIKHFGAIPIGKLSEEVAEARNKDFRKYRESHSRKVSRTATNEDIIHNLLLSSDPKITSLRPRMVKQNIMVLSPKVKELLLIFPTESDIDFIDVDNLQDSHSDSE
ncbi:hypothetical protein HF086_017077 [Spodoptera exigua]|uniref:Uncharacterized protein n=1 Tax=Spodoptera exigua TaxID=7107 RepID=A0A922MI50_SPOEX|nr:hypothetical protein HF086_017077 [Spodoptera exigua]